MRSASSDAPAPALRRAEAADLPALRAMYAALVGHMRREGVRIWDDVYPVEFLAGDVAEGSLYVLTLPSGAPCAAFALHREHEGARGVAWEEPRAAARYLDRLGVDCAHLRRGLAGQALRAAARLAREDGARYLRLFAAEGNAPALRLYARSGFRRAAGVFPQDIGGGEFLPEYGFELRLHEPQG